jgi:YHS domain-containing protein
MKHILITILFFSISTFYAQDNLGDRLNHFNLENKLALEGYDVVSYFENKKPKEGDQKYSHTYKGVVYYFESEKNKAQFISNPSQYEPMYGGWCAYAMGAKGDKVSVDPETYKIIDGQLYLFYNAYFNNTLKSWNKDENNLKSKADQNWESYFN